MKVCPVCGKEYDSYPAISRRDNVTEICPDCGLMEAIEDWVAQVKEEEKHEGNPEY